MHTRHRYMPLPPAPAPHPAPLRHSSIGGALLFYRLRRCGLTVAQALTELSVLRDLANWRGVCERANGRVGSA